MSRTNGYRLSVMIFGLAVCLTMPACRTSKEKACDPETVSTSSDKIQDVIRELKTIIIPEMTFYSPATIVDAVEFFKKASRDTVKLGTPSEQCNLRFELNLPSASTNVVDPRIAAISVRAISLFDAIQIVCQTTDMSFSLSEDGRVMFEPRYFSEGEPYTRSYTVPQALEEYLFSSRNGQSPNADPDKVWKAFFEQLGVSGPKWAEFSHLPAIGKLRVTNTSEHLSSIEAIFDQFPLSIIEVEMQIHAFRTADIEQVRLSGGMSLESLTALRRKGKGKPIATATVLTKSGQEAIVRAVQEVRYPTELVTDVAQIGSNMTARSAAQALMPGNFERRELGMILQVLPETVPNNMCINLVMKPQWITLERWEHYPADLAAGCPHKAHSFRQPVFGVTTIETQAVVKDGETVLVGSCSTPDGEWVQVGFLTARVAEKQKVSKAEAKKDAVNKDESVKKKMQNIVIPEVAFRPPATIIEAIRFFKEASIQYDDPELPEAQRGVNFVLKLSEKNRNRTEGGEQVNPFAATAPFTNSVPVIPAMSARFISLYDVFKLVCDVTGMKFKIRDNIVWVMPMGDPDESLVTRIYTVPSSLFEEFSTNANIRMDEKVWKEFFAQMGVNWPMGSAISVTNLASISLLRVTNTPENLDVFEQVLEDLMIAPRMVEVDVQIHAFWPEDIEQVRLSGDVSVGALMALRKKGKAKQVASATVVTKSGQEACVKAVQEVIYPTELSNSSGQGGEALIPSSFEMREVGMILKITPELVNPNGSQVSVTMYPRWGTLEGWKTYPADRASGWTHKTTPFKQPIFGTTSFETQTIVQTGETVLLGSSSTPDGKWVHVGFLTVK